jgi:hypothetical protein
MSDFDRFFVGIAIITGIGIVWQMFICLSRIEEAIQRCVIMQSEIAKAIRDAGRDL